MKLAWGARVSAVFRHKVLMLCADELIPDPSWLMACMQFESQLNPAARNKQSGYTGLIQFSSTNAEKFGTSWEALAKMSAEEQLDYVQKYFHQFRGRIISFCDCYMAILWPAAIGEPDDRVIFSSGRTAYLQNRGLDFNHDNAVTKAEACSLVAKQLELGLQAENAFETESETLTTVIDERVKEPTEPTKEKTMAPIAAALLQALIPQVLQLFQPRAQAEIAKKTGSSEEAAGVFYQNLIGKVGELVHVPVVDDTSAVQAVAKLTADPQPAVVQELQDHSLDFLDKLAPVLEQLVSIREREVKIDTASADAASVRADSAQVRRIFQSKAWWALSLGAALIGAVAALQVWLSDDHQADAAIIGAMIFAFGQVVAWIGLIAHYGYGTTGSSGAKDVLISELSRNQKGPSS